MTTDYQCVIVANGLFPSSEKVLSCLRKAEYIIACDGAVTHLHERNIKIDAIVGDLDSIPANLRDSYRNIVHHIEDQEINDLTKAVCFAERYEKKAILILGGTGLREDHAMGNISLLMDYACLFDKVEMVSDYGIFTPILKNTVFESYAGQQVSIFSMSLSGEITAKGLRWPITDRRFTAWWQGTLNESTGDTFSIELSPQTTALVYRAF